MSLTAIVELHEYKPFVPNLEIDYQIE